MVFELIYCVSLPAFVSLICSFVTAYQFSIQLQSDSSLSTLWPSKRCACSSILPSFPLSLSFSCILVSRVTTSTGEEVHYYYYIMPVSITCYPFHAAPHFSLTYQVLLVTKVSASCLSFPQLSESGETILHIKQHIRRHSVKACE